MQKVKDFFIRHKGLDPTCSHIEAVKIFKKMNDKKELKLS